jgi:L-lactate dehydrogenase complex protein LldE
MKVQLFIPCFIDQIFPETARNTVKILEKAGCEVYYNPNQTCCGQPAYNAGYWEECLPLVKKFDSDFASPDYIVSPGGSCVGFVRNHYNKFIAPGEASEATVSSRIYELSEFLTDILHIDNLHASFRARATFHDACGALRECGIKEAPRKLLHNVSGLELIESDDCEVCCGFGGTFAVKHNSISSIMAEQKVQQAQKNGIEFIISTDYSCLLHLDGYIKKQLIPIKTIHIADVLAAGW